MNRRIYRYMLFLVIIAAFPVMVSSCGSGTKYKSYSFYSMDTIIEIRLDPETPDIDAVFSGCREVTESVRLMLDADDEESEVAKLNNSETGAIVSPLVGELCRLSGDVYTASGGKFDITLRPLINLWKSAETDNALPDASAIVEALSHRGITGLTYDDTSGFLSKDAGVRIDLGGIGKGAAADAVLEYLSGSGAGYGVISFGGNIALYGAKPDGTPFTVSLRDPAGQGTVGDLSLDSGVISVSGDYERYYEIDGERYHHIFDPETGYPAESGLHSVAVICDDGATADALSTALFVMGYDDGMKLYESGEFDFEAVFISDSEIRLTPGLTEKFTLTSGLYTVK